MKILIIIIIIYIVTELIINLVRIKSKKIDDHGHTINQMGKATWRETIREWIAKGSWKIFLWAIKMTDKEYWYHCYKAERNRMCVDSPPREYKE